MGNSLSLCPEPVQALAVSVGLSGDSDGHPSGIVVKGVGYSTVKLIGEGGFAFVYEGINNVTGETVALKRYVFAGEDQQRRTVEEMRLYQIISPHENIVTYRDSEAVHRPRAQLPEMFIVMEYCSGPSLQDYINNRISMAQAFAVREVYEILDNILHAVGHLHSQSPPISHWDIKPDNFLFVDSGVLKLCDFGSATQVFYQPRSADEMSAAEAELEARMTFYYRAPETLDLWSKCRVDTKADIWAIGVLVYVLVFKEMPFEASVVDIVDAVPKQYRETKADPTPDDFKPLMRIVREMMLVKDPAKRSDVFAVSEAISKINHLAPLDRPRPSMQSAQRPRF